MFYKMYKSQFAINRHLNAPLLLERLEYLQYWFENGTTLKNLRNIADNLLIVIDYLRLKNKGKIDISDIKKAAKKRATQWIRKPNDKRTFSYKVFNEFVHIAVTWLRMLNRIKSVPKKKITCSQKIYQYADYILHEKKLEESTVQLRLRQLEKLFHHVVINRTLNIKVIDKIILKNIPVGKYSRYTIQNYLSTLRLFLEFAEAKNWSPRGLAASIRIPRIYKYEALPYSPSWDEVKKILASTEGNLLGNIRDRAVILLLATYAMRSSEVCKLCLSDFNWREEILYVRRAKGAKPQIFPLTETVGEAVVRYIEQVRPNSCRCREVFICLNAPYRPLSTRAMYYLVNKRIRSLNLEIEHQGPHSLRHACATHLINQGVSLREISTHLGHKSLNSTQNYAKVDLVSLRKVSDFYMGDIV